MKNGDLVRFNHERDGGPVHKVVSVMADGMIEIHDMGGYFASHLFAIADDVAAIPPDMKTAEEDISKLDYVLDVLGIADSDRDPADCVKEWIVRAEAAESRATAAERALAEHRERWQRLVNEIAGAFNNGMVVGDDAESIENAIGLIQAAARLLEAAEADLAAFNKFVVVCDDENSTLEQANEAHLAYQETSTAVRAAVAALQAAGSGEGNTMTLPPDDVQPSHWKPLPARPGAQEDDTHG
jgi:hypothetical protein